MTDHISTLPPAPHRFVPALHCYLAYGLSIVVGYLTWIYLQSAFPEYDPFVDGLIVTTMATFVVYIFSIINNNSSIYDPYWVIAPPFLVLGIKAVSDTGFHLWHSRDVLILLCFVFWAGRYHIFYAWAGWRGGLVHEDWRYEEMRSVPIPYWLNSFIGMHYFPTYLVYFAFAPAVLVLMSDPAQQPGLNVWDLLAFVSAITAVLIEFLADKQNADFRNTEAYRQGGSVRTGLWKYSRHPNYFGEVLFWLSMIPFGIAAGLYEQHTWLILGGPIAMAIFFRGSSWLMDRRSLARRPGYQVVVNETSAMVPWFPKK